MISSPGRRAVLVCWCIGLSLLVQGARADSSLYFIPSFSIGRVHDDNLFSTPTDMQADSLWRFSPALEAGYESETTTIAGFYTLDAERYAHHTELDSNTARRSGALNLTWQATPRLSTAVEGDYTATNSLAELAPGTIVEPGRAGARVITVTPSLKYAFDEITSGKLGYSYSHQDLYGGPSTDIHTASTGLERLLSRQDTLDLDAEFSHYQFGGGNDQVDSKALILGWTHAFTPDTSLTLSAGPRYTAGDRSADYAMHLRHTLEAGEFTLDYVRTQTAVVGQVGVADTRSVSMMYDCTFGGDFELQILPSYAEDTSGPSQADDTRLDFNLSYKLGHDSALVGSYQFNRQHGLLGGIGNPIIFDRVIYVGLSFSFPTTTGNFVERRSSPFETLWPAPRH